MYDAAMTLTGPLRELWDWLLDGVPGASSPVEVIERFCVDLRRGGVPLDRFSAFVRTLHPQVAARSFYWLPGQHVEVGEASWSAFTVEQQKTSPMYAVFADGAELRCNLARDGASSGMPDLVKLATAGFTDYLALPMRFVSGHHHGCAFATRAPAGFSDEHVALLRELRRPLARVADALALTRTAANLISAYVGRDAGQRVLDGQVQRGAVDEIRCAVWFSDMRGFSSLSSTISPVQIVALLNKFFDAQVVAIEAQGGEVLKFIGDGLFAIFPFAAGRSELDVCTAALAAARDAVGRVAKLNVARGADEPEVNFGIALHVGDVAYGNIGGANRLDFTCVGNAVNTASRIEGLTGRTGQRVLVSEAFAKLAGLPGSPVGTYELKGIAEPQRVYAP
jgi:adenylate cyclase